MPKKVRVGILLNSMEIKNWQYTVVDQLLRDGYTDIECLVIEETPDKLKPTGILEKIKAKFNKNKHNIIAATINRVLKKIQAKVLIPFNTENNAFSSKNIKTLLATVPVVTVKPNKKKYLDIFTEEDVLKVSKYNLDVLVRFGFRILRGEILTTAKFGVWSYHHGDNRINRGGPAGYWETMESWPTTGSILQILSEDLDNGVILYRSKSSTKNYSVDRNKNQYYWKSVSFIPRCIKMLYHSSTREEFFSCLPVENNTLSLYDRQLYTAPTNRALLANIVRKTAERIRNKLYNVLYFDQWILLFSIKEGPSTSLWKFKEIQPPKDRFWADPFIVFKENRYFIFIEEYCYKASKGCISVIEMESDGRYQTANTVLEKPYHLSYPFVFEHGGDYYMIPETSSNRTIELYKCSNFPDKWELEMTLMENIRAVDVTLYFKDGTWFLFANITEHAGASSWDELFLYYAPDFKTTEWKRHPKSPIISDVERSRPAGRMFRHEGVLYRPSQDSSTRYGHGLNLNAVNVLSEANYEETLVSKAFPKWDKNIKQIHSFAYEENLTVIDGKKKRRR